MPPNPDTEPTAEALLGAAIAGIGGSTRPGQVKMAQAVEHAITSQEHLAVQAGTGTGKSLAYLVPAVVHAAATGSCVVVATATIALQRQLIDRDLPRLAEAVAPLLGRPPTFAILKGRRNYLCLHRLKSGAPEEPGDTLFDPAGTSNVGRQVARIHEWAGTTETGDRDELVPGVEDRAWRTVSVNGRECLGAPRCPFGSTCFAERAREAAGQVDVVVTNHALLAIDALEEFPVLPEHDVVVIDEAHDLVNRVTSAAAAELSAVAAQAAGRRCARLVEGTELDKLSEAAEAFGRVVADAPAGRVDILGEALATSLAALRDACAACATQVRSGGADAADDAERLAAGRAALASLDEIRDTATRVLGAFGEDVAARPDVVWLTQPDPSDPRHVPTLRVAPLDVGDLLAERMFRRRTVVLTSATLALGGSFEPLARQWGLPPARPNVPAGPDGAPTGPDGARAGPDGARAGSDSAPVNPGATPVESDDAPAKPDAALAGRAEAGPRNPEELTWSGMDVGSPFDHPRSGILYVARHLQPPGRDGLPAAYLTELRELIEAAGGRTLGLFSSMRAARQAADELRDVIEVPLLCQGEDATAELVRQFTADEATCLFGTLSLWQGVDVPGPSLQLVVIDRIPFPRPDDPLASARQRAVAARGGNGFMAVAAAHAALLLAQGAGRLLRTADDRGMVAVLDPRLATARYAGFLRTSLPPFWATTDPAVARAALRRLAARRS
ncbi:MAG TPA: ATP-dependent DNA helicase [Streptosporangiaceae bacterium]|nr:ATP-dependent DNA helicase [Streptosporangiaceae bacterium]